MYRLLIVDDEEQIVDWLYELFQDESGLNLDVYKAYSAYEAVTLLNSTKIDIVLSDIYMPGMDGVQLLKEIRKNWSSCRVIFLSGHRKFEYALEAINNDCVSYLMKTEDDDVIIEAVKKAMKDIDESLKNEELIQKAKREIEISNPILQKEFIFEVLLNTYTQNLNQLDLDEVQIPLKIDNSVFLIIGNLEGFPSRLSHLQKRQMSYTVKIIMEKYFAEFQNKLWTALPPSYFMLLIQPRNLEQVTDGVVFKGILEMIQASCREALGVTASFIISDEITDWISLSREFVKLKQTLDFGTGIGTEMILTTKSFKDMLPDYSEPVKQTLAKLNRAEVLSANLEAGNKEVFFKLLDEFTGCLKEINSLSYSPAVEIYYKIATCLLSHINKTKFSEAIAFRADIRGLTGLDKFHNWEEAVEYLHGISNVIFDSHIDRKEQAVEDSIKHIKDYINNHLSEDLSLVKLSEVSYFNPSYLSRLFKQATGENLSDYIIEARINKAKELLKNSDMKIFEIALAVGCESSTYLGRVFKKHTGKTPQEYRDRLQRGK
jgi:two-component system response regulator YesN